MSFKPTYSAGILAGALAAGALMGGGLVVSGMTLPDKVLGFLDLAAVPSGQWDATLMFVLGGAVVTAFIGYRLVWRLKHPLCASSFQLPSGTRIDVPLIAGAALFGIGWGLAGYCPGPALANLVAPTLDKLAFVAAMIGGAGGAKVVQSFLKSR